MKRIFEKLIPFVLILSVSITLAANAYSNAGQAIIFSNEIVALTPRSGERVSVANDYIKAFWNSHNLKEVTGFYEINDEIRLFTDILTDREAVRELYKNQDGFKPSNNILKWHYEGDYESFTVTLSREEDLSKVVYKAETEENELLLDNILLSGETYYWQVTVNKEDGSKVFSRIFNFFTENYVRTVDIDGVSNTRDIGGYDTPYGRTLQGLVYRGAMLDDITEKGKRQLDALGIKTDLDLRAHSEGTVNPSDRENYINYSGPQYTAIITDAALKSNLAQAVRAFADPQNYPIFFHCSDGRDRTGTLSFILNSLLGLRYEELMKEYLISFFSVAGTTEKVLAIALFENISYLYEYLNENFQGENYAQKTENYLKSIGITQNEIDTIRDIWTGKITVLDEDAANENGFSDQCFVTFISYGHERITLAVQKGGQITAPYHLDDEYIWTTVNGEEFDLPCRLPRILLSQQKN